MWTVTTTGDLPDDFDRRRHSDSRGAWDDYHGRILALETGGFSGLAETAVNYGREWVADLHRGTTRITVTIERTAWRGRQDARPAT